MKHKLKLISSHLDKYDGEYKYKYRGYEIIEEDFCEDDCCHCCCEVKKDGKVLKDFSGMNCVENAMEYIDEREKKTK